MRLDMKKDPHKKVQCPDLQIRTTQAQCCNSYFEIYMLKVELKETILCFITSSRPISKSEHGLINCDHQQHMNLCWVYSPTHKHQPDNTAPALCLAITMTVVCVSWHMACDPAAPLSVIMILIVCREWSQPGLNRQDRAVAQRPSACVFHCTHASTCRQEHIRTHRCIINAPVCYLPAVMWTFVGWRVNEKQRIALFLTDVELESFQRSPGVSHPVSVWIEVSWTQV